jgi:2-keto-4-pentenoate hydratase
MDIDQAVSDLSTARLNAGPLVWPADFPVDLAAGYRTALAVRAARIRAGDLPIGYKVGFTNRTIWPRYQVSAPIWGTVWDSTRSFQEAGEPAVSPASQLSLAGLCEPRIEPEIIFGLRSVPPAGCTLAQLVGAIGWLAHGFEIVHTHFPGWKFTAAQGVADGGLHGLLRVDPKVDVPPDAPAEQLVQALSGLQVRLSCDGVLKDEGMGANVLDGPLQALMYFVQELRALPGAPGLQAGDVITTGTLTDAWPVQAGQTWHTELKVAGPLASQLRGLSVTFT